MKFLGYLYQHVNILSLDVAAGAVISSLFFARLLNASVSLNVLAILGLTVWIIYTLDHLRDARSIPNVASTDRHRFHQKHFRIIFRTMMVIVVADAVMIAFLPPEILKAGTILGSVVLIYLAFQRYLKFLKELFVACLYTAGVLLPPIAMMQHDLLPVYIILIAKFFITALMNLLIFSLFDYDEDRVQQQHSFVTWFGPASTRYSILLLGLLNIVSGVAVWEFDKLVAGIFVSMNLVLLAVLFFQRTLGNNNSHRIVGDAVFFIPGIYFLLNR